MFFATPRQKWPVTQSSFLVQPYSRRHLNLHMILHRLVLMVGIIFEVLLRNKKDVHQNTRYGK